MQPLIVVPLDGSRLAEQALPHAAALARAMGSVAEKVLQASPVPLVLIRPAEETRAGVEAGLPVLLVGSGIPQE